MPDATADFRKFFRTFALVSALVVVAVTKMTDMLELQQDQIFIMVCWGVVAGLTLLVVYGSLRGIASGNFATFQGFFLGGVIGKIMLVGGLFAFYSMANEEKNMMILVPFAVIYFPYLLLETIYLTKASRASDAYSKKTEGE